MQTLFKSLEMRIEKGKGIQLNIINKPTELLQVNPMGDVLEGPNRAFSSSFLYFLIDFCNIGMSLLHSNSVL